MGGGIGNVASGTGATIPGGSSNRARGITSFAAGNGAIADNDGAFVWADGSVRSDFNSTSPNQFLIRAAGGVGIGTNTPATALDVNGNVKATKFIGDGSMLTNLPAGGSGVTQVNTGASLTGGPITTTGTVGIAPNGVTNTMLQNSSLTVNPGTGLSGGGAVALGSAATLSVDTTVIQNRVAGTCPTGNAIRVVNSNGTVTCEPVVGVGGVSGSGTATRLTKFVGPATLGDSQISDDGMNVTITVPAGGLKVLAANGQTPNIIAGSSLNAVVSGVVGGTIAGGGDAGAANRVTDTGGTVGGGRNNQAGDNDLSPANSFPTVSGGVDNTASGVKATVGGGGQNTASGLEATVSGGRNNSASGTGATVPGGLNNQASGPQSFAAGSNAKAIHPGAFVWADSNTPDLTSTAPNQFLIQAAGGVGIGTNNPAAALDVNGKVKASVLMIPTGAGPGKVLTSDLDGNGTWVTPSAGGVTRIDTGIGLTGGPITGTGSISIAVNGVPNDRLQFPSLTVSAGTGLSGGGLVQLGSSITLNNAGVTALTSPAGSGLTASSTTGNISLGLRTDCGPGQLLKFNSGVWTCAADDTSSGGPFALLNAPNSFIGQQTMQTSTGTAVFAETGAGTALLARSNGTTGITTTVQAVNASSQGIAVSGTAASGSGATVGGSFASFSHTGGSVGVRGEASNAPVDSIGVDGTGGIGVNGISHVAYQLSASGGTPGSGVGVLGVARFTTGNTYGGWFQSLSSSGVGVYGENSSPSGFGVFSQGNLHVEGNITYSGDVTQSSSRRWKTNIEPMTGALEKVERLQGVTYDWKESGRHNIGLIAEEVQLVVPEVVAMEENGVDAKGVDYGRLTSLLIEAVKEQQSQIRKGQDELQELKAEMQTLHSQLKLAAEQLRARQSEGSNP